MEGLLKLTAGYFGAGFSRIHKPYPHREHIGVSDSSILGTGPQMFGESYCNLETSHVTWRHPM